MHSVIQLSRGLAAPPIGPPLPAPAHAGPAGEWVLAGVILAISLVLDATAAGDAAKRDRVAAGLTYAATLGMISVYGWAATIQGMTGDTYSWRVIGSVVSVAFHVGFFVALAGPWMEKTKVQAAWLSHRMGITPVTDGAVRTQIRAPEAPTRPAGGGKKSGEVGKINTKLHLWAAATASTYVLARGDFGRIPELIGTGLTRGSAVIGMWFLARFGG